MPVGEDIQVHLLTVMKQMMYESVVFLAGAALDLISLQQGRDYSGKILHNTCTNVVGDTLRDTLTVG